MQVIVSLLLVILSLTGIADAGYITYNELSGIIPPCTTGFQCETVLSSAYSQIGGIPLSVIGFFYYSIVLILSILHFLEFDFSKVPFFQKIKISKSEPLDFLQLVTAGGIVFSAYLIIIMAFVLKAWCLYCLISATTSALLFITVNLYRMFLSKSSGYFTKGIIFALIQFKYRYILKPIFFLIDAETVHNFMIGFGKKLGNWAFTRWLLGAFFNYTATPTIQAGITFPNRVGLSAGFDYNGDLTGTLPAVGFGWHTIGTVTLKPYAGNQKPRLGRFPKSQALLVNKGLKNDGAVAIIDKLKHLTFSIPTGISIASTNKSYKNTKLQIADIVDCFKLFEKSSVKHSFYELNISCPNTFGGEPFTTPERLEILMSALEPLKIKKPIFVKMPIDQSEKETLHLLKVLDKFIVAGVIFGNLTKDKNNPDVNPIDAESWKEQRGNLSGKPTFERSNKLISLTKKHFKNRFVIVGTGGIFSAADANTKLHLGADLVQLITGMIFKGPQLVGSINRELQHS